MDEKKPNRRDLLSMLGASGVGVVFSSGLAGCDQREGAPPNTAASVGASANASAVQGGNASSKDFFFVQITDTHWGYKGPANPESDVSLKKVVALINTSTRQPDFIIFTGDLTHTTDDPVERRKRLREFKEIVSELKCKNLKFIPGEHDGSLDNSEAFRELFGETMWTFDHQGVHFIAIDNVSDIDGGLGEKQLAWIDADLSRLPPEVPVVVFAHRPLFPLQQQWEWWTRDGAKALAILQKRKNVTVFYGHIHQEHHYMTGHIAHHSARSMIFQLPVAGSVPKRAPLPWKPENPDKGIGFRQVVVGNDAPPARMNLTDFTSAGSRLPPWQPTPLVTPIPTAAGPAAASSIVAISAKRFAYTPDKVTLKRGVPVTFELTSTDRVHGFLAPDFDVRAEIKPGEATKVSLTPTKTGSFRFHCDRFCGEGHNDMFGTIVVVD